MLVNEHYRTAVSSATPLPRRLGHPYQLQLINSSVVLEKSKTNLKMLSYIEVANKELNIEIHTYSEGSDLKGAALPIIPSAPKCSSRYFTFHRKYVCYE